MRAPSCLALPLLLGVACGGGGGDGAGGDDAPPAVPPTPTATLTPTPVPTATGPIAWASGQALLRSDDGGFSCIGDVELVP